MDRRAALESHVRSLSAERIADLLATLSEGVVRYARATPQTLLYLLPILAYRPGAFERLTLAHHQVLYAAVGAAEDRQRLRATRAGAGEPRPRLPAPVDHETLLARLDADRPGLARVRAEETVADLVGLALLWPDGRGGYHLPDDAFEQFGLPRVPPPAAVGLGELDLAGVRRIALTLGLDPTGGRGALTEAIVRVLGTTGRVRDLCRTADGDVAHLLLDHAFLGREAPAFLTRVGGEPIRFPANGTGDPDLDWMFERGLLLPAESPGTGFVMPREVALAVRSTHPWPFDPGPQAVVGVPVEHVMPGGGADVVEGARRALTALARADVRLLDAVAEQPPALRGDGLLAPRERRRLSRVVEGDEDLARVWLEAGAVLGLLGARRGRVVLSEQAGAWRRLGAERRLAALAEAWAGMEDASLWWPSPETADAPRDRSGRARTRWAVACALNDLPWGTSTGVVGRRSLEERAKGREPHTGTRWLVAAVTWYQPSVESEPDTVGRVVRASREAELLGAVFGGATTEVGRALSRRCRGRWQVWPHGSADTVAAVRRALGPRRSEHHAEPGTGPEHAAEGAPPRGTGAPVAGTEGAGGCARRSAEARGRTGSDGAGPDRGAGPERDDGHGVTGPAELRHRRLRDVARDVFGADRT
ncbi:hypothetical protein ABZ635_19030 [Nocardiopsis sp. NPDC007018]|uniref:hypothetical protein n=1 Tax=Nocardiopsis sp. NPDC007018 TaxID=3155721 RepID=UPI0033CBC969